MSRETWLDKAIDWLSPQWGLKRARARAAMDIVLSYEAARNDRHTAGWLTSDTSANAEIGLGLVRMRQRSRDLVRNNSYATRAISELADQAVGTGIRAAARPYRKRDPHLEEQTNAATVQ